MELHNYLDELFEGDEFVDEHYKGKIYVKLPTNCESIPQLSLSVENHTVLTIEEQKEYFKKIKDKDIKINCINGDYPILLSGANLEFTCDVCGIGIRTSTYYYCNKRYLDICYNCYNDDKIKCSEYPITERTSIRNILFYCSLCHTKVENGEKRYSDFPFYGTDYEMCICLKCSNGLQGRKYIVEHELSSHDYDSDKKDYSNFGSFLDWIPVIKDKYQNMVLINLNKDSDKFSKVCLVSSNIHKQKNYFTTSKTLEDIAKLITDNSILSFEPQSLSNWTDFFLCPIKKIMLLNNFPIYN